ncbi:glycosyltransferase, partial [bacterium]|nr:glycosyltransferase [bacterium]
KIFLKLCYYFITYNFYRFNPQKISNLEQKPITCFFFLSTHLFEGLKQRPHHIALKVAKKYLVQYICPIYTKDWSKNDIYSPIKIKQINPNLKVIYIALFGGNNLLLIRYLNLLIMELSIKFSLKDLKEKSLDEMVLWLYDPRFEKLRSRFPKVKCVYDIMDEHTGFPWSTIDIAQREKDLLRNADVVFAGTNALYNSKKEFSKNIHFYSCGVDFDHFNNPLVASTEKVDNTKSWKGKILGYFGTVDMRIDQDLIDFIASRHPEYTIVLIGPVIGDFSKLTQHENMILTGSVDYEELPSYLAKFDVALIPFVLNELTMHINPTKVLEYFAGGKPVVSVAIPDIVEFYSDTVFISRNNVEFEKNIISALDLTEAKTMIDKGFEKAKAYSWESTVESMLSKVL